MINLPATQDHALNNGVDNVNEYGSRSYFDPIHGYIKLNKQYWDIIDTVQFQRLRNLKQLGCCHLVFPSATHNRFEHCIGTCYLARKMVTNIRKHQKLLEVTDRDVFNVSVAGLCHDLGHGPFSHVFDNFFIKKVAPSETWTHEEASAMLLEHMVEQNNIELEQCDVRFIQDLILGKSQGYQGKEKMWLFDLINNKRNSIDVDKFDYIMRDTHMMDLPYGVFDYQILLKNGRVIDDQICYPDKNAFEVIKLFQSRYELYRDIYNHRTVHSVELLLCDVLLESHGIIHDYTKVIRDPELYQQLSDQVIFEIEMSDDPRLKKAQDTIKRIKRREFYLFAGEKVIPNNLAPQAKSFTEKDVINCASVGPDGEQLREEDIVLRQFKVNFAMGDKNPFERVKFYRSSNYDYCQPIDMNTVSAITPTIFQEMIIRLFVKDSKKYEAAHKAFNRFCKEKLGGQPIKQKDHNTAYSQQFSQYSLSQQH